MTFSFFGGESLYIFDFVNQLQGDGEQLHPDLQRILELELNDYHFLRLGYPGVFT
jgi:hypothetical protein